MPFYEYRCQQCGRKSSHFIRSQSAVETYIPKCPRCGSEALRKLVSRVYAVKSEGSRMDSMADDAAGLEGLDENDPKGMAQWMRKMSQETGEDLGPEFHEVVDRLEKGQSPEEIEKEVPGLAEGAAAAGGADMGGGDMGLGPED